MEASLGNQKPLCSGLKGRRLKSIIMFFVLFFCIITLTVPEAAVSRLPPEGNNEVLCPASAV